jgi:NifU-like protein involved in Fe-S cluster formation
MDEEMGDNINIDLEVEENTWKQCPFEGFGISGVVPRCSATRN